MNKFLLYIPIYEFKCLFLQVDDDITSTKIKRSFRNLDFKDTDNLKDRIINRILTFKDEDDSGGRIIFYDNYKFILILLKSEVTLKDKIRFYNHEKQHLVSDIATRYGMLNEEEAKAYLDGFISAESYNFYIKYLNIKS